MEGMRAMENRLSCFAGFPRILHQLSQKFFFLVVFDGNDDNNMERQEREAKTSIGRPNTRRQEKNLNLSVCQGKKDYFLLTKENKMKSTLLADCQSYRLLHYMLWLPSVLCSLFVPFYPIHAHFNIVILFIMWRSGRNFYSCYVG